MRSLVERSDERRRVLRAATPEQLSDVFDNASVGIHLVGADGIILHANRCELEMLGYAADEYIGHHVSEFHVNQETIANILQRLANGEVLNNYESQLRRKDGSVRDVLISSSVL
jgi:PAS domain S-box-containing protein